MIRVMNLRFHEVVVRGIFELDVQFWLLNKGSSARG